MVWRGGLNKLKKSQLSPSWYLDLQRQYIYNSNEDIKFMAHDACLEWTSSGTLNIEILKSRVT
jgi:hypothetical protein